MLWEMHHKFYVVKDFGFKEKGITAVGNHSLSGVCSKKLND